MKVVDYTKEESSVRATLAIDHGEFIAAMEQAYLSDPESYPLPGHDPSSGLPMERLQELFSQPGIQSVAMDMVITAAFGHFAMEHDIWITSEPQVLEMAEAGENDMQVTLQADILPGFDVGNYKGIAAHDEGDEDAFTTAVLTKAVERVQVELPENIIEQKLQNILEREKGILSQDPIFIMLADTVAILGSAYRVLGVVRPKDKVLNEAFGIIMDSASAEQKEASKEQYYGQITKSISQYRTPPKDFEVELDRLMEKRRLKREQMSEEQQREEIFEAYLGTTEMSREDWREQRRELAVNELKLNLLLDTIARREKIKISQQEMEQAYIDAARDFNATAEQIRTVYPEFAMEQELSRTKAIRVIIDSAIRI